MMNCLSTVRRLCGSRTAYATTTICCNSRDKQKKMAFDSCCAPVRIVRLDLELRGRNIIINLWIRIVFANFSKQIISILSSSGPIETVLTRWTFTNLHFLTSIILHRAVSCVNRPIYFVYKIDKFNCANRRRSSHFCNTQRHTGRTKYTQWR